MTRDNPSNKTSGKAGRQATSGGNRGIFLVLAGFTAAAILAIALFGVLSTTGGQDAGNFTPNDQGLIPAGSPAPEFTTKTIDGKSISLNEDGDYRATMLVFFASWCPHCQNEAPIIDDLESKYEDLRIIMIGADANQGDTPEDVREFVNEYGIESPAAYDPRLGQRYQLSGYPLVYVIDENGEIVAATAGEAPREAYEGWIEEALRS